MAHFERKMVPLYLTNQEKEQLNLYAEIVGASRQKLLEAMIASCCEDLDIMDRMDFLVSEVRVQDQLKMFKELTPTEKSLIKQTINQD